MSNLVTQESALLLVGFPASAAVKAQRAEVLAEPPAGAQVKECSVCVLYDLRPPVPALVSVQTLEGLVEGDAEFFADTSRLSVIVEGAASFYADTVRLSVLYDYREISPNVKLYIPVSDYLLPTLPGLRWDVVKRPVFSTGISQHVSGREVRVSNYAYPLWTWEMSYEFLRAGAEAELQTLMGFFLARGGSFDTFLFDDPDEQSVLTAASLGVGNDSQTKFTMWKEYAGFQEPCGYVDPDSIRVYFVIEQVPIEQVTGWSLVSPNQISFEAAVPDGVEVLADYRWYYRVRFGEDSHDYNQFLYNLWELGKLTLQSVKP